MNLKNVFFALLLLVCASTAGQMAAGLLLTDEAGVIDLFAPESAQADDVQYLAADGVIRESGKAVRIKQIEFSCLKTAASTPPCFAFVRVGTTTAGPPSFPLSVTAGSSRTYDFWHVNGGDNLYGRQVGVLLSSGFYDEITGDTHAVLITDRQ